MFKPTAVALLTVCLAFVSLPLHANAKTLLQNQIQYGRLSQDPSDFDRIYEVVVAGMPTGNFVALLSRGDGACTLEIVSAQENKIVFSIADRLTCAQEYEHEDGYTIGHAHQFLEFLNKNVKILKPLLEQYKIDYSQYPDAVKIPSEGKASQCAKLASLRICKSKNKRVTVIKNR